MDFYKIVYSLIDMYYTCYPDMEKVPVNVIFTESLSKTHCELRPDAKARLIADGIEIHDNQNGRMVPPHKVDEKLHILLNSEKVIEYINDKSMTWIGTIAHELTHAIDFYQMARKESLKYYDILEEKSIYSPFQLWSEYHARKLGYAFLRKVSFVDFDSSTKIERIEYILEREFPYHLDKHFEEYHRILDSYNQKYITMQLLGRYSVWCDLFPDNFNENAIIATFKQEPWMHHLFSFLRHHETLESVYDKLEQFDLILQENW